MWYVATALVFTVLGGAGGFLWGAKVERKALGVVGAVKKAL